MRPLIWKASAMPLDGDDDRVGYKRPPPWGQFRKGQSGNPNGRPRKKRSDPPARPGDSALDDILRAELDREIRVNDATGSHPMAMLKIIVRAQTTEAAKGNVLAQRDVLKQARELEVRNAERKALKEKEDRRVFDYVVARKALQAKKWADAERTGVEPIEPWPHPDDMFIDQVKERWRVRGPWDEADLPLYKFDRAYRDALFARMILDWRQRKPRKPGQPSFWDIWLCFDMLLPKRWQIVELFETTAADLLSLPLRELRARCTRLLDRAERLRALAPLPAAGKDDYRLANRLLQPLLKLHGYRSLAEFERNYEMCGGIRSR